MQQPVALLLLLVAVVATTLAPVFELHRFGEEGRLARDSGLACMLFLGLLLALTASGSAVAREIAGGTAAAILSKPVRRGAFLASKFAGILTLVGLFWIALLFATLLAERASVRMLIVGDVLAQVADARTTRLALMAPALMLALAAFRHYRRRARFGVTFFLGLPVTLAVIASICGFWQAGGRWQSYHPNLNMRVLPAALLILAALAICTALATALATRLPATVTVVVGALLALVGLGGDAWVGREPLSAWRSWPGVLLGGALPNIQNFWLVDALARNGRVPWAYVGEATLLAATWCAAALAVGAWALRRKELG